MACTSRSPASARTPAPTTPRPGRAHPPLPRPPPRRPSRSAGGDSGGWLVRHGVPPPQEHRHPLHRDLAERILPFHGLLRDDLRGLPVVIPEDGLYVTESRLRKNTGT